MRFLDAPSHVFYALFLLVQIVIVVLWLRHVTSASFINAARRPIALAIFAWAVIALVTPLAQHMAGAYRYSYTYSMYTHLAVNFFNWVTIFGFYLGYGSVRLSGRSSIGRLRVSDGRLLTIAVILIVPAVYFAVSNIVEIMQMGVSVYLRDRIAFGLGSGYKILIAHNLYVVCALLLSFLLLKRYRGLQLVLFGGFILLLYAIDIYYYSINGNRNSVFILLLVSFLLLVQIQPVLYERYRRFFYIGLALMFIVFASFSDYRWSVASQNTFSVTGMSLLRGLNGAFGNNENMLWLVENSYDIEYAHGATYLAALTNVVPRSVWPEKPTGGGPFLKNTIYPGAYVVGRRGNSSLTTGLQTEAFINFGYFGLMLFPFLFGALLKFVFLLGNRIKNLPQLTAHAILVVSMSFSIMYSEFLGLFTRIVATTAPLILLAILFRKRTDETILLAPSTEKPKPAKKVSATKVKTRRREILMPPH